MEGQALKDFQERAIDVEMLFKFLEVTQPKKVERLKTIQGDFFERRFLNRVEQEPNRRGVPLRLAYKKPPSSLNKILNENYQQNIFTVNRQVYYSKKNKNSFLL